MSRIRLPGCAFLCALALPSPALAQSVVQTPEVVVTSQGDGSLVSPNTDAARRILEQTPGGVELVPDTAFKSGPANTIKDILDYVPGVIAQPRWGFDGRISIRGSGLTRNYGNRGVNL